jgi:hypothetical protein
VTVDVEAPREFRLARQAAFVPEAVRRDFRREYLLDLPPDGDARAALDRCPWRCVFVGCHVGVIPLGLNNVLHIVVRHP